MLQVFDIYMWDNGGQCIVEMATRDAEHPHECYTLTLVNTYGTLGLARRDRIYGDIVVLESRPELAVMRTSGGSKSWCKAVTTYTYADGTTGSTHQQYDAETGVWGCASVSASIQLRILAPLSAEEVLAALPIPPNHALRELLGIPASQS